MKFDNRQEWIFELQMLVCGVLATCVYAMNFGIGILYSTWALTLYPLSCLLGGILAWRCYKGNGLWRLAGYVYLFSTLAYVLLSAVWSILYSTGFSLRSYMESLVYWLLCALLPVVICVWAGRLFVRRE